MEGSMKIAIFILASWLHLVATVVWIGGIVFILFVAIPSSKEVLADKAGNIMGSITKRFSPLANYSIIALIITGVLISITDKNPLAFSLNNTSTIVFLAKHLIVLFMIIIHFYRGLMLAPKIARAEGARKAGLAKLSLNLVKVNLCLGLAVLLLSAALAA